MSVCACDPTRLIKTGFDDIPFRVIRRGERGEYADWIITPVSQETHIPGTNITYVETMGYLPARVTWPLEFCCSAAYYALLARYRTAGTLTVLAGFQSLKGTQATYGNRVYERLDQTFLYAIDETPHFVGGVVQASVTFWRAVDPVTREAVLT